jgi:hypothetical protein
MIQERRQHQRLVPDSPAPIYLGEAGSVLLFDVSEGGVGVACAPPAGENKILSLAFDLPGVANPIRARAETAWTGGSSGRAGFRFLELTDTSRLQLKQWITSRAYDTAQAPAALPETLPATVSHENGIVDSSISPGWHEREFAGLRAALVASSRARPGRLVRTVGLTLAIAVFIPVCLYLGHLLGDMGDNVQATGITRIAKTEAPAPKTINLTAKPPAAAHPDSLDALSIDRPGFVLQAGAMTHEAYAEELRQSLQQKDFPAFVFRRSTGQFYRVAVGPYGDAQSAAKIQAELKGLGFDTILKPWSPE